MQKSRAKTLQIIEWFQVLQWRDSSKLKVQAVAENIQISSESEQLHIQEG